MVTATVQSTVQASHALAPENWFASFEHNVSHFFQEAEADVVKVVVAIKTDVEIAIEDIDAAMQWLVKQTPNIATGLETAAGLIEQVGLATHPEVAAAIEAANLAVQGLNAFAAAANSGKTMPVAVVNGYLAFKSAQSAVAGATAAAVKTPTPQAAAAVQATVAAH